MTARVAAVSGPVAWPRGFDPERLTRDASLNKLVVGAVPGARRIDVGRNGRQLLGRDALAELVLRRCGVQVGADVVADWLAAAVAADPSGPAAAVADEVGERLASLVATLRHPATAGGAEGGRRPYLEAWQTIDRVILGGGLMKDAIGERVAARAAAALHRSVADPPSVEVGRHRRWLALLGAARSAPSHDGAVVVVDCGHTSIKPALALVEFGMVTTVRLLPRVPVASFHPSQVGDVVAATVADVAEHHGGRAEDAVVSIAAYVRDGRPIVNHASIYEQLDPVVLERRAGAGIRLIHDGTAAWRGTGSATRSAVIVLGTWLGVGIGPHRELLRPYSEGFTLQEAGRGG